MTPDDKGPRGIEQAIEDFCRHRRANGQTAKLVNDYYRYPLRSTLLPFCVDQEVASLDQLTPALVEGLVVSLYDRKTRAGKPVARATVLAYMKVLRHFMRWAAVDDAGKIVLPRQRRIHRDVLTEGELKALEEAARNERDALMIRLFAETGMREGELANLTVQDIIVRDGRYHFLRVHGKTGERMPPITAATYRRLAVYRAGKTGRPRTDDPHLFIADRRRAGDVAHEALTEKGIYRAIKLAADRAALQKRVFVHLLRHTAITRMVTAGMHPALVSEITGVSVAVIARHYSHPTLEQTHEALMRVLER